MDNIKLLRIALTTSLMLMTAAISTQAATLRAFVSSTGNDANAATNCAQTAPCRTFAGAFPTVTAGGELIALDTAGYGPLTNINKAITVAANPGVTAFVVAATGTAGFTVNGGAADVIILRNISFNGSNAANTTGVLHNSGKLILAGCRFQQLTTGLSVINSKADVDDCSFDGNTVGIKSTGPGEDDQIACCTGTTQVRVAGGYLRDNGTAIQAVNPGFRLPPGDTDNRKPFLFFASGNSFTTSVKGNTNFHSASGTGCTGGCFTIHMIHTGNLNPR